ncbi:sensor histidine kinase [Glaciibacter superstes]|uniref:sensor histidine kinase n=1 Tax=Glaciibacter superstes TaxID=501023 RepID=UPI0003B7876B|nr:HAMP domain-containing sensor histidine kinase [Glaciibacter superstes]
MSTANAVVDTGATESNGRRKRLTVRMRLTLTYALLFSGAGALMLGLIYAFMRYVPTYAIRAATPITGGSTDSESARPVRDAIQSTPAPLGEAMPDAQTFAIIVSDEADILDTLLVSSIVILLVLTVASAWAGWLLSGRLLRPLQEINAAAGRAASGSFDHRIALAGPRDEITNLSDTFDHMLERLDRSFHAHQRFAANASHELRTPLAATQAMLDVAAGEESFDQQASRELIKRLRATNDRSIETVEAMLDLADLDNLELHSQEIDLGALVSDVVADSQAEADARGITMKTALDYVPVEGEPTLLAQAVANLVANAIRHNHDGGVVTVSTSFTGSGSDEAPTLTVSNSGAIVPTDAIGKLTEPFYRNTGRIVDGHHRSRGLGLAIVENIVSAHGAELHLVPAEGGGLVVTVKFKRHAPDGHALD